MKTSSYLFSIVSFLLTLDKSDSFTKLPSFLPKWQGDDSAKKLTQNNFGYNGDSFNIYSFPEDESQQNEDDWLSSYYRKNRQKKSKDNLEANEKKPKNTKNKGDELTDYYKNSNKNKIKPTIDEEIEAVYQAFDGLPELFRDLNEANLVSCEQYQGLLNFVNILSSKVLDELHEIKEKEMGYYKEGKTDDTSLGTEYDYYDGTLGGTQGLPDHLE